MVHQVSQGAYQASFMMQSVIVVNILHACVA